jgi:copper transport protein
VWIGGLIVITCIAKRTETLFTAQRLSSVALASVVTLAASGSFNGWRQLHGLGSITDSSYGRWLLVKLVVVVVVVVIAAINRALVRSAAWPARSPTPEAALAAPVRRLVFAELAGIVVILAATAGLTGATPPAPPGASDVSVSVAQGNLIADIELIPARTGGTSMHVTITATDGQFVRVSEITVTAVLAAEALGPIELPVFDAGPNHVTSNDADFPVPGLWSMIVTARLGEFDQAVFTADVAITSA